ncbi:hypothetical protein H9P43_004686 [Blastocladiella emersonii ATCC 22665]|nr:hypothetical protein H9P43_004686 [Blastocladiella emersonii ATCC 22665]
MPPKRAKGLKKSTAEPASKRARGDTASPAADASAADPSENAQTLFVGDVEEDHEVAEVAAMLHAATSRIAAGDADQGRTLLRGTVHEAARQLGLAAADADLLPAGDHAVLRLVYALALFWTAAYGADEAKHAGEFLDIARDTLAEVPATVPAPSAAIAHAPTRAAVQAVLKVGGALLAGTKIAQKDLDVYADAVPHADREAIAWIAHRRLTPADKDGDDDEEADEPAVPSIDTVEALWQTLDNDSSVKHLGVGQVLLLKATAVVEEQGERAEADKPVDKNKLLIAAELLDTAHTLLAKARDTDDHPNEANFLPLAETCVNQGAVAEMLDEDADKVANAYMMAVAYFKKAAEHAPDAVDAEMLAGLEDTIRAILAEQGDESDESEVDDEDEDDDEDDEEAAQGESDDEEDDE